MQQYYGLAMSEFVDGKKLTKKNYWLIFLFLINYSPPIAQNIINEMKVNVNSLSKISHPEKYLNVIDQ